MSDGLSIGKIFGIPLRLHYTWFIIFVLVTASLVLYFPIQGFYPLEQRIILGILTSALFFVSIIIHELAHSILAIRNGIPVKEITLFAFGGVSQITKEATQPKTELLIAVVGPLASLGMASVFYGLHLLVHGPLAAFMWWLATINVILALFNLIPGFPLDGGRVFRAIIWRRTNNYQRATSIATKVGQGVALLFAIGGIGIIFALHLWLNGLWLIFIAWFLYDAAKTSYQQTLLQDSLSSITVRHVMEYGCPVISPKLNLGELVREYILPTGRDCFLIAEEAALEGMITLHQIKKVPKAKWNITTVEDVMTPASKLKVSYPDQDVLSLLTKMDEANMNHMPVIEARKIIGIINRRDLSHFLHTRANLGMKLKL